MPSVDPLLVEKAAEDLLICTLSARDAHGLRIMWHPDPTAAIKAVLAALDSLNQSGEPVTTDLTDTYTRIETGRQLIEAMAEATILRNTEKDT